MSSLESKKGRVDMIYSMMIKCPGPQTPKSIALSVLFQCLALLIFCPAFMVLQIFNSAYGEVVA